eukprot:364607-Chlamydomonas_euryale.AAC.8
MPVGSVLCSGGFVEYVRLNWGVFHGAADLGRVLSRGCTGEYLWLLLIREASSAVEGPGSTLGSGAAWRCPWQWRCLEVSLAAHQGHLPGHLPGHLQARLQAAPHPGSACKDGSCMPCVTRHACMHT